MSQRITDSIKVLNRIQRLAQQNPNKTASSWRKEAIAHVASRGVDRGTIFSHLVGKNTTYTLSAKEIDHLITTWITEGSTDLKNWFLKSCEKEDEKRVSKFFSKEQSTPIEADIKNQDAFSEKINLEGGIMESESTKREYKQSSTQESQEQTEKEQIVVSRKQIGIRLLYTILFLVIFGFVIVIVKSLVVFQFIYFLITRKPNELVRQFSNKISTYGYRILRYISLNENQRPFPFTDLPPELEPTEEQITFE